MKVEKMSKRWRSFHAIWLSMVMLCFVQCKESSDGGDEKPVAYDPGKPVSVTGFLPKGGGAGSNLVVYGDNFGNDVSRIKVMIGGKIAKTVSVKGNALYCIVPSEAFDGDVNVYILDEAGEEELAGGEAPEVFAYERKWVVSDLVGKYYEVGTQFEEKEGPFDDCGAFKNMIWFTFDPKNPNQFYIAAESSNARVVDLETRYVSYFRTPGIGRKTVILWRPDGDRDLLTAENHASDTRNAFYTFSRSSNFTQSQVINQVARGVNGAAVHPINGELYYSLYRVGVVYRYDLETGTNKVAFSNPFQSTAVFIVIHPSGDYAYITNYERSYILKSEYDHVNKIFRTPYPVAGLANSNGWSDGVGTSARLNRPVQGVFVKNPDYEEQGGDQYDYYFCDKENHAIRKLTPQGRVSTYAGRGNNGTNGYANGDLRLEARFNQPTAIAFDETRNCFYVGEQGNWIIRKISLEGE